MPANPELKTQKQINDEFTAKCARWAENSKGISDREKTKMKLCGDCINISPAKKSKDLVGICRCSVDGKAVEFNRQCINGHFKVRADN